MYETTRQRVCKWLLLAVLVFSTLDAALFALFDIGMERLGLVDYGRNGFGIPVDRLDKATFSALRDARLELDALFGSGTGGDSSSASTPAA